MLRSGIFRNKSGEIIDFTYHPTRRKDVLVIMGHGLTGNKDRPQLVALAEGLAARDWPCMRISYSGNGDSEGRFEEATPGKEIGDLKSILEAVPDWVRVIYVGHSMGAAVGVLTAERDLRIQMLVSLAGMVRTAAFYEREFSGLVPGTDCMWDEPGHPLSAAFAEEMKSIGDLLPAAARITQPWLLIHGTDDDLVPVEDSRDAHAAAVCPKRLIEIEGAGHSFDESSYPRLIEAVDEWMAARFGRG